MRALYRERYLTGLTISEHPLAVMRPWLDQRGFISAKGLRETRTNAWIKVAGEVVIVHTPPQRNLTRVIFVTIEDETGLVDLALFPRHQAGNSKVIMESPLVLIHGRLSRRGLKDGLVVVHRAWPAPVSLPGAKRAAPRGE